LKVKELAKPCSRIAVGAHAAIVAASPSFARLRHRRLQFGLPAGWIDLRSLLMSRCRIATTRPPSTTTPMPASLATRDAVDTEHRASFAAVLIDRYCVAMPQYYRRNAKFSSH